MTDQTQNQTAENVILGVDGIRVAYGARAVLNDFNLHVMRGEIFGLMGLNGAGKTTLIKAILALRGLSAGRVMLGGHDNVAAQSRHILAYLPERFDPPSFLNGMEFIRFSLSLYGQKLDEGQARHLAERLALDPAVLKNRVQTYSKGMRQKLGLIATIMTGCPLLILDEPMSGLDPLARARLKNVLHEVRAAGRTVFLSTHVLSDMDETCDRVGVLHDGQLLYVGTPADLRTQTGANNMEYAFLRAIGVETGAAA